MKSLILAAVTCCCLCLVDAKELFLVDSRFNTILAPKVIGPVKDAYKEVQPFVARPHVIRDINLDLPGTTTTTNRLQHHILNKRDASHRLRQFGKRIAVAGLSVLNCLVLGFLVFPATTLYAITSGVSSFLDAIVIGIGIMLGIEVAIIMLSQAYRNVRSHIAKQADLQAVYELLPSINAIEYPITWAFSRGLSIVLGIILTIILLPFIIIANIVHWIVELFWKGATKVRKMVQESISNLRGVPYVQPGGGSPRFRRTAKPRRRQDDTESPLQNSSDRRRDENVVLEDRERDLFTNTPESNVYSNREPITIERISQVSITPDGGVFAQQFEHISIPNSRINSGVSIEEIN